MSAVAKRYARAAVAAAAERGNGQTVEALAKGLRHFSDAYAGSQELREVLSNPALRDEREAVLAGILEKINASRVAANLIRLLSEKNRLAVLPEVVAQVEEIADERAGRLRAAVTSAIELTPEQVRRVADALEKRLGRPVVVSVQVDPEILGGMVCRVGDLTFDTSLRRQLELLREQLGVGVH